MSNCRLEKKGKIHIQNKKEVVNTAEWVVQEAGVEVTTGNPIGEGIVVIVEVHHQKRDIVYILQI